MKSTKKYFLVCQCCILLFSFSLISSITAQDSRFTVVLDAGHGGHDPGAKGDISREKDINLSIVLELGRIISQNSKDVKIVYTRKTDVYLTLQERADVVNNNHADLFICIHTNSAKSSSAFGAETFTLGLAKTKANLDVAMRENSVILLEENYHTKYKGFDPNSVDSYIMFEFMQDKYIDRSIELASSIQNQFVKYSKRSDRGVRQAGFWVLHRSACPSVLVEVGFISNKAEEQYLNSDQGRNEMATAVYNAFLSYKKDHDKKSGRQSDTSSQIQKTSKVLENRAEANPEVSNINSTTTTTNIQKPSPVKENKTNTNISTKKEVLNIEPQSKPETVSKPINTSKPTNSKIPSTVNSSNSSTKQSKVEVSPNTPIFKVQIYASKTPLKPSAEELKGVENSESFVEFGYNKYTIGAETEYVNIVKLKRSLYSKFPDAFIIAFVNGTKISEKEALKIITSH
jgi:N-acetylmuramoyl-L-alanine amidase